MNVSIESTLEINTEGLPLRNFVIACVITQDEPDNVQGPGTPDGIFSALLMIMENNTGKQIINRHFFVELPFLVACGFK